MSLKPEDFAYTRCVGSAEKIGVELHLPQPDDATEALSVTKAYVKITTYEGYIDRTREIIAVDNTACSVSNHPPGRYKAYYIWPIPVDTKATMALATFSMYLSDGQVIVRNIKITIVAGIPFTY